MLWLIFILAAATLVLACAILATVNSLEAESDKAELTEADRNLLLRHIRVLEENTKAQRKGRP